MQYKIVLYKDSWENRLSCFECEIFDIKSENLCQIKNNVLQKQNVYYKNFLHTLIIWNYENKRQLDLEK